MSSFRILLPKIQTLLSIGLWCQDKLTYILSNQKKKKKKKNVFNDLTLLSKYYSEVDFCGTSLLYMPMGRDIARRDPTLISLKVKLWMPTLFKPLTLRISLPKYYFGRIWAWHGNKWVWSSLCTKNIHSIILIPIMYGFASLTPRLISLLWNTIFGNFGLILGKEGVARWDAAHVSPKLKSHVHTKF